MQYMLHYGGCDSPAPLRGAIWGLPIGGPRMSPRPRVAKYGATHGCNPSRGSGNVRLWSSSDAPHRVGSPRMSPRLRDPSINTLPRMVVPTPGVAKYGATHGCHRLPGWLKCSALVIRLRRGRRGGRCAAPDLAALAAAAMRSIARFLQPMLLMGLMGPMGDMAVVQTHKLEALHSM
ncbi:MAG: hypothetical protein PUD64_10220 [Bacteroidales bacterium]|nr:hypothetical protein [Bacteroidales bacterium]